MSANQIRNTALREIVAASYSGSLALFLGAGISRPSPSSVPTADEVRDHIYDTLASTGPIVSTQVPALRKYLSNAPFELLMSYLAQLGSDALRAALSSLAGNAFNSMHAIIGQLLIQKRIQVVLTTNFDNLLEKACGAESSILKVCWEPPWPTHLAGPTILKLHGTLETPSGGDAFNSVQSTVESLSKGLPLTKTDSEALLHILKGKYCVFMGYSGRDRIDIFPLLLGAKDTTMLWIDHVPDLISSGPASGSTSRITAEVEHIISRMPGMRLLLRYDTKRFLDEIANALRITHATVPESNSVSCSFSVLDRMLFEASGLVAGVLLLTLSGHFREAAECLNDYIRSASSQQSKSLARAHVCYGIAIENYGTQQKVREALESYQKAHAIFDVLGEHGYVGRTLNDIGLAYQLLQRQDSANECFRKALIIGEQIGDLKLVGMSHHNIARLYQHSDPATALSHYQQATLRKREAGELIDELLSLEGIAYVSPLTPAALEAMLRSLEIIWQCQVNEQVRLTKTLFALAREIWNSYGNHWETYLNNSSLVQLSGYYDEIIAYLTVIARGVAAGRHKGDKE